MIGNIPNMNNMQNMQNPINNSAYITHINPQIKNINNQNSFDPSLYKDSEYIIEKDQNQINPIMNKQRIKGGHIHNNSISHLNNIGNNLNINLFIFLETPGRFLHHGKSFRKDFH